jgi:hypothetical protein
MQISTKDILDRAMELEKGNQFSLICNTSKERDVLYSDLRFRRSFLIRNALMDKYESVVIGKDKDNNVILSKIIIASAYIRKADGTREDIKF